MTIETTTVGPGTITVGETGTEVDFSAQILAARVSWSVNREDSRRVLNGEILPGRVTRTAAVSCTILQDIAQASGIVRFSWANRGQELPFVYVPATDAGVHVTGTVTVEPIDVGGDVDADAESEFEWQFVGEPDLDDIPEP